MGAFPGIGEDDSGKQRMGGRRVHVPSGMLMTTQRLIIAIAMTWRSITVLPVIRSPTKTLLVTLFSLNVSCIILPYSTVSGLTTIAGRENRLHPWLGLNAWTARNLSTKSSGIPTTFPIDDGSVTISCENSSMSLTGKALVLESTTRFLRAFRSPMAGRFPLSGRGFFFFLEKVNFWPFTGALGVVLETVFLGGRARRVELVENGLAEVEGRQSLEKATAGMPATLGGPRFEASKRKRGHIWGGIMFDLQ